jgi:two-component system, NtrC family, nitrogen regulation sensor histidine kinase GlnL
MTPYRTPYPVPGVVWASLPLPALLIGPDNRIAEVNPAGETFLNASSRSLMGQPAFDRLAIDAPMDEALVRARLNQSPLFINDVDVTTGERAPVQCNIQVAPMHDNPEVILLIISPRDIADRLGRAMQVKSAAKSAIGMAEMLAHEIKNPLAGISGAAQLIGMNLPPEDRELADLIVPPHRQTAGTGGTVRQSPPTRTPPGQHP